jgi:type IV secretion system protein TrbE
VQVLETVSSSGASSRIDPTADQTMMEAEEAQIELAQGTVTRGYLTNSIIVMVPSGADGLRQAREIERIILNAGLVCEIESFNAAEVILGSIPGNLWHDVTRHGVNSAAASCIFPVDAPWRGTPVNPHLGGPSLMQVTRGGCLPFFLNLHVGDVGHFLSTGWTGGGKSTKLNAFRLSHRARHPRGQLFSLDKGRSSKVLTLAVGGRFVDFGQPDTAIQPLRHLEDVRDRTWAYSWIMAILHAADAERAKSPDIENEVSDAIATFRDTVPADLRTLTTFQATVQDFWVKQVLRPYTHFGDFGHIFDGVDAWAYDDDVVTFEIGDVLNQFAVLSPLVDFLFHLAERRADPDRPMMFIADEAWAYMRPPFSDRLEVAIREMRRNNVQIGFATQSIFDAVNSPAAHVILSNCPTRFYLPDPDALQPQSVEILEGLGLRHSEIEALAHATPKRQYMMQQKVSDPSMGGIAVFDMTLGPVGLALCATTGLASQRHADAVVARWGKEHFLYGWLMENGLPDAASVLASQPVTNAAE